MHKHLNIKRLVRPDVIKLSLPVVTEQVFTMSMGIINTIMVGHVGNQAVSAVGIVDSLNNIFIAFFAALSLGGTVVVAHYVGHGDADEANDAAVQAMFSGVMLAILITLAIWLTRHYIMIVLYGAAEPDVIENSYNYLNITLFSYPFIAITSIACGVLRGAGDTRTPMKITMIMNVINFFLGYILIYGLNIGNIHFSISIPGLGVRGAAIGIATARAVGALLVMQALHKGSKIIKLKSVFKFNFNLDMQKRIFSIGIPASVESLLFNGGKLITQVFIVGMGTVSIAANYISGSVFSLVNVPGSALGVAATTLVGQHMGKGEKEEAGNILMYLIKLTSVCMLILCAFTYPFAATLASMYTRSSEVIALTAVLIRLSSVCTPILWPLAFLLPAGLKGAGDTKYAMVTSILGMWAFRISLGYILGVPLKMGVTGVWLGMYVDWLVRGILYYIRLKNGKWAQNAVIREINAAVK